MPNNSKLPQFRQLIIPSFLSIRKGVKIGKNGIHSSLQFKDIVILANDINGFARFIGIDNPTPFVFLYILAQRAQAALMLQKEFTIAIPGLVHIGNKLQQIGTIDYAAPFDIQAKVDVDYKDEGSLIPVFSVELFQKGTVVARCESTYLAKRKSNKPKSYKADKNPVSKASWQIRFDVPANAGRQYAKVAGDRNPIHTSTLLAKLFGFKRPIAHGWYLVSRIVRDCELKADKQFKTINVDFKAPAYLPSGAVLQAEEKPDGSIVFALVSDTSNTLLLTGTLA